MIEKRRKKKAFFPLSLFTNNVNIKKFFFSITEINTRVKKEKKRTKIDNFIYHMKIRHKMVKFLITYTV